MFPSDTRSLDMETAYAKINLALHVRGRLPGGYHAIETIFAFLDGGDRLSVVDGKGISLSINGEFSENLDDDENLVLTAARLLEKRSGQAKNAQLILQKNLPVASGIGGGSADAGATLRLLNRYWQLGFSEMALVEMAETLGADVPACIASQTCFGKGIGQDLMVCDSSTVEGAGAILVNPKKPVSTAMIFSQWDRVDRGPLIGDNPMQMAISGRNDLQSIAETEIPEIVTIIDFLATTNAEIARMSGSGATCFALYKSIAEAKTAEAAVRKRFPSYWSMTGCLR